MPANAPSTITRARTLISADAKLRSASVEGATIRVPVGITKTVRQPVFGPAGPLTKETSIAPVSLPVYKGQRLGRIVIKQDGHELARVPVVATKAVLTAGETVGSVPVSDYIDKTITARAGALLEMTNDFDETKPVQRYVYLDKRVSAPVAKGQPIGTVYFAQDGKVIARAPARALSAVTAPTFSEALSIAFSRGWLAAKGKPTMAQLQLVNGG
jgi:D-alanyl-D-alanine carboxypeptidase